MDSKIVDKIKKLLSLANSDNENEAKLAAERANEIMTRYNLVMRDISTDQYKEDAIHESSRVAPEWKFICHILSSCFFVESYRERSRITGKTTILLYGEQHNIQIATYVAHFLKNNMPKLFNSYKQSHEGVTTKHKQAYYLGLTKGLIAQLKEKQQQVSQELGLVIVKDPKLNEHLQNIGVRSKTSRIAGNMQATGAGYEQGKKLNIQNGLSDKAENRGRFIG